MNTRRLYSNKGLYNDPILLPPINKISYRDPNFLLYSYLLSRLAGINIILKHLFDIQTYTKRNSKARFQLIYNIILSTLKLQQAIFKKIAKPKSNEVDIKVLNMPLQKNSSIILTSHLRIFPQIMNSLSFIVLIFSFLSIYD